MAYGWWLILQLILALTHEFAEKKEEAQADLERMSRKRIRCKNIVFMYKIAKE